MAAQMGVWRLLENDSVVNPVHAALLHTGSVLFFAGSGNDVERHMALQYATAVWHYPAAMYSQPPTPVDLFCCGHSFLADGRLLASGGTGSTTRSTDCGRPSRSIPRREKQIRKSFRHDRGLDR